MPGDIDARPDALGMPEPLTIGYDEAAALMGCGRRTVERMVADGEIPYSKVRGLVRFRRTALEAWLDAQERGGSPAYVEVARKRAARVETPIYTQVSRRRQGGEDKESLRKAQ